MFHLKSWKALGLSATLISLMLISALVGTPTKPVEASQDIIELHAILGTDPLDGEYSGYHEVMWMIRDALKEIGIDLKLHYFDYLTIYDYQWYTNAHRPGAPPGWDMGLGEWWCDLGSMIWEASMVTEEGIAPDGSNIMPYLNPKACKLMKKSEATIDAEERQKLLWKWQEICMHDLPMIPLFYLEIYDLTGKWIEGFDPNIDPYWRGNPYSHLSVNRTMQAKMDIPEGVVAWGEYEDMAATNPMFIIAYCEDSVHIWTFDTLYSSFRDPWPPELNRSFFDPEDPLFREYKYSPVPNLAVDFPVYSKDYRTAYIPLRDNVDWVWSNNTPSERFDAEDVVWTFTALLDPESMCESIGSFSVIDSVVALNNETLNELGELGIHRDIPYTNKFNETYYWKEPYAVKFNLKEPHADFVALLYNTWGAYILPEHVLGDVPHSALRSHKTNCKPELLPGTGPWRLTDWDKGVSITLEPNSHYWKNAMPGGFEPFKTVDKVICKIIPDPEAMKVAQLHHDIAWGLWGIDYAVWNKTTDPYLNKYSYQNPCFHPIYLNLANPILANRYVRQAIAHAIPYEEIFPLVKSWGKKAEPAKTIITPVHFYTEPEELGGKTVSLYNDKLPFIDYNLTKAHYYMDLYLNQTKGDYTKSPLGDADQSGLVDLTDWDIWARNIGTNVTTPIWTDPTCARAWPFTVDPDFNNDGDVLTSDVLLWSKNYGTEYEPFVYGTT